MNVRFFRFFAAVLLAMPLALWAAPATDHGDRRLPEPAALPEAAALPDGIILKIEFAGLRRIPAATLRAQIRSREGQPLDTAQVEDDVRALDRLGWFDSVTAEVHPIPVLLASAEIAATPREEFATDPGVAGLVSPLISAAAEEMGLRLVFVLEERPFLARLDFRGSRVFSRRRIDAILAEKQIALKVAAPASRTALWRATRAIETALADAGHPQAQVRLRLEEVPTAAVRATFEIHDGPSIRVAWITFAGNHAFSEKELRRQMKRVAPEAHFAALRGKNIYTRERLAADLERLASYYRNHGYPEAHVGQPAAEVSEDRVRRWLPFTRRRTTPRFHISIPVEEGRPYRLGAIELQNELAEQKSGERGDALAALRSLKTGEPYSQEKLERAREALARAPAFQPAKAGARRRARSPAPLPEVELTPRLDPDAGVVRVTFRVREPQPYIIHHIEFSGLRRFNDRYYRRRILLKEGEPFDPDKLELGLAQLARTGFIRPVKRQDISVRLNEAQGAADVAIRVEEIGRQRASLVGGHAGVGSTIGVVYNVFDLFGAEELLTAHLEGGPESLQVLLGLAKEGLFGTRASFGFSLFQNVLRPNLLNALSGQRQFTSRSSGLALGTTYPVTLDDTLGLNYQLSRTSTQYHSLLPPGLTGLPAAQLSGITRSRSVGLTESRDVGHERLDAATSVSGGWLGGSENLLRGSVEYARLFADPFGASPDRSQRRAWAFRGYFAGVSSYRGDLPLYARFYPGEQLVRGFRTGELGPYALVRTDHGNGTPTYRAQAAGADLAGAVNAEYRLPIVPRSEAAAFFDAGSGWLLPSWLGPDRPTLLGGTNGALRSSAGIELRWQVPGVELPVRVHYALNPLRLSRALLLPNGSRFRPPNRRTALGWAFGTLF
jgi:outer membrane protein insertion porin family